MSNRYWKILVVTAACLTALVPLSGAGPSFRPDTVFKGSSLTGWRTLGDATWRAQDGEIVGTAKQPAGGWLLLDRSYQDVGFYASFQCAAGCQTGVLLRAEKTADGLKGILVSLNAGDIASYRVTLDAQGRELTRERLRSGGGSVRIAPPPPPDAAPPRGAGPGAGGPGRAGGGGEATRRPARLCRLVRRTRAFVRGSGTRSRSCSTPISCARSSMTAVRPRAAWPTTRRDVSAPSRCSSAAPARCGSRRSATRISRSRSVRSRRSRTGSASSN